MRILNRTTSRTTALTTTVLLCLLLSLLMQVPSSASDDPNRPVNVTGKWQLSWEARLGTERGTVQIEQTDSKLTGAYQGRLGSPKVSGNIQGAHVSLTLEFQSATPYSLVFAGTVDGDKMAGKFEVQGVGDGYDSHGENAHPTDYSWTAVRQPDQNSVRQ